MDNFYTEKKRFVTKKKTQTNLYDVSMDASCAEVRSVFENSTLFIIKGRVNFKGELFVEMSDHYFCQRYMGSPGQHHI